MPRKREGVRAKPSQPTVTPTIDGYKVTWVAEEVEADLTRLADHSDGLTAEVEIRTTRQPRPGLLRWGRLDLMAERTRASWAAMLYERDDDLDWDGMLEQLTREVRDAHRNGSPAIDLRAAMPRPYGRWLVEPFVPQSGASVLFAMGGTGKSMVAMAIAATAASGVGVVGMAVRDPVPVLYLDWETDQWTARERLQAIVNGHGLTSMPMVHYRRQVASIDSAAQEIRREVARLGAGMVVVDSMGAARGGEPESAELTIRTFNALRSLAVPALIVDHVTKASGNDAQTSFGSVYTHNLARLTWGMDKAQEEGADSATLALINRKWNDGRALPRMGLQMNTQTDEDGVLTSVTFAYCNLADSDLAHRATIPARIRAALRDGGKTPARLAVELDMGQRTASLRRALHEMKSRGEIRTDEKGEVWLAAHEN